MHCAINTLQCYILTLHALFMYKVRTFYIYFPGYSVNNNDNLFPIPRLYPATHVYANDDRKAFTDMRR